MAESTLAYLDHGKCKVTLWVIKNYLKNEDATVTFGGLHHFFRFYVKVEVEEDSRMFYIVVCAWIRPFAAVVFVFSLYGNLASQHHYQCENTPQPFILGAADSWSLNWRQLLPVTHTETWTGTCQCAAGIKIHFLCNSLYDFAQRIQSKTLGSTRLCVLRVQWDQLQYGGGRLVQCKQQEDHKTDR